MSDSWVKIIVDEIKTTNQKIDDLREDMANNIQSTNNQVGKVYAKAVEIETNVKNIQKLTDKHEITLYGNGHPGLNSKMEMFEARLSSLQIDEEKEEELKKVLELENKKYSSGIKIAIISGIVSGTVALITLLVETLIK